MEGPWTHFKKLILLSRNWDPGKLPAPRRVLISGSER